MDADETLELLCFHRSFLRPAAESHPVRGPASLGRLGASTALSASFPPPQAEPGRSPLAPTESVCPMRRSDPRAPVHPPCDLVPEGECARLPWSPLSLTIDVMTAPAAPVNVGDNRMQTKGHNISPVLHSLHHSSVIHNPPPPAIMAAAPSVLPMPSMQYPEFSASPHLGHDPKVLGYYDPVTSGSPVQQHQLASPIMSRTPSFGNGHDHFAFNRANHLVSPAPSGAAAPKHFGGGAQGQDAVYTYTAEDVTQRRDSGESSEGHAKPYATLIFEALMSRPDKRMVLRDIYAWFEKNTDKAKDPSSRGWQNSIRHNLSMNGAFRKEELPATAEDGKKGYVWVLEPTAIDNRGVQSTTRFRKAGGHRGLKREPAPAAPARARTGVRKPAVRCPPMPRRAPIKTEPPMPPLPHVSRATEPAWSSLHALPITSVNALHYPFPGPAVTGAGGLQPHGSFDDGHPPFEAYAFPPTPSSITPSPTQATHSFNSMGGVGGDGGLGDGVGGGMGFPDGTSLEERQDFNSYVACTSAGLHPSSLAAFNYGPAAGYGGFYSPTSGF